MLALWIEERPEYDNLTQEHLRDQLAALEDRRFEIIDDAREQPKTRDNIQGDSYIDG